MCFYPSDQQRIKRQYPEFSRATGISNTGRWLIQKYMSYQKSKAWSDNLMLKNSPEKIACNWDLKLSMSKPKLLYLKKKASFIFPFSSYFTKLCHQIPNCPIEKLGQLCNLFPLCLYFPPQLYLQIYFEFILFSLHSSQYYRSCYQVFLCILIIAS